MGLFGLLCASIVHAEQLIWIPNVEPDIAGYNVFANGAYVDTVMHEICTDSCLWLIPPELEGTNIFKVTAFDWRGLESEQSAPAVYARYPAPTDTECPTSVVIRIE